MFKVGDKVRCVDNGLAETYLTIGKVYTVIKNASQLNLNERIVILCDNMDMIKFYSSRFELDIREMRKDKLEKIESRLSS